MKKSLRELIEERSISTEELKRIIAVDQAVGDELPIDEWTTECHIKTALALNNMTARELAAKLGVTTTTVSKWVTGQTMPSLLVALKIADILNCEVDDIFTLIKHK